jgi:hypothetical protein
VIRLFRGLLPALCLALPALAGAQEWRLGTQVGRLSWEGAGVAGADDQSSVALVLTRTGYDDWIALSAGSALEGGSLWATLGSGRRRAMDAPIGLGLDVSSHLFVQRVTVETIENSGAPGLGQQSITTSRELLGGAAAQTMALGFARHRDMRLEVRAGAAGTATYMDDDLSEELTPVVDGRLTLGFGALQLGPEAQHWHQRATYAGGTAVYGIGHAVAWASAGQWTHGGPDDVSWSAGAAVALPHGLRLDASYRDNGFDPLYAQPTGRTMAVGMSVRLGGGSRYAPPVPARARDGSVEIRLRARDVSGTPSIAGDFNGWKPVPMTANGESWIISLPLEPGVYHYAFVNEDGEWFVPEDTPGRRSDGMGGWQAVLVVAG